MFLKLIINIILIPINIVLLIIKVPLKLIAMPNLRLWIVFGRKKIAKATIRY
jgi:hypothetical protein